GYRQLSMNQGSLARINYLLRRVAQADLDKILVRALSLANGFQVRELVKEYLNQQDLITILN
ncbi:MAG: hypothetical protein ACRCUH_05295, partial [Shewanella sp.]